MFNLRRFISFFFLKADPEIANLMDTLQTQLRQTCKAGGATYQLDLNRAGII